MSMLFKSNILKTGTRMINLLSVSKFDLLDNKIKFHYSNVKELNGSFLYFYGRNDVETFIFINKEEAKKEFENIEKILNNYYK